MSDKPYLSVVTASRNDDHGGDPLLRTQIFITNFARQCQKYQLPAELIIVDWNPFPGRPGLAAVLNMPSEATYCKARVITVPEALHRRLKYGDKLHFFQMIAKNVGIRRAEGQFILATNIDILFSDELISFVATQRLDPRKQYRVDRYDIKSGIPQEASLDEALNYAWTNPIRSHRRYRPEQLIRQLYGEGVFNKICRPATNASELVEGVSVVQEYDTWQIRPGRSLDMSYLHTNACGDFTLLSREGWNHIRGYPEFEAFSFNIDSMGMLAAHYAGYEEVSLLPPCVCFHIEHNVGSGWTPEGEKLLFDRLRAAKILNPEWVVLTPLVDEMRTRGTALEFNHSAWGMANFDLPEQTMGDAKPIPEVKFAQMALKSETHAVSAIQPAYDLDRLTLFTANDNPLELVEGATFYMPDSTGQFNANSVVTLPAQLNKKIVMNFRLEKFSHQFPLRFDPCQCRAFIRIHALTITDADSNKVVWHMDGDSGRNTLIKGTAVAASPTQTGFKIWLKKLLKGQAKAEWDQPFCLISTGTDPQLIFPRLASDTTFPVEISVEMEINPFG